MATHSKATLAKLISELTGKSERYALDGYSDEQIAGMVLSVAAVLTPDQVFNSASVAQLAVDRSDLYNDTEAIVYAATSTPALVFSGGPGVVKLEAWAHANGLQVGQKLFCTPHPCQPLARFSQERQAW